MSILGERYFKTSNAIYCYGLGCRELAVYGYLRSRAGSKETCWPSMQTIAAACGCSDTTARKAVDELERRGFIRRVATYATDRRDRRRKCNNTYYLLDLPPLPGPRDRLTYHKEGPDVGAQGRTIGAPIEAQRSGFDGERRSSETSDFSPVRAEMSGVELATTKAIYKNVLAKTQKECKEKLAQAIEKNGKIDVTKAGQYTVEEWCWLWHENYCKPAVKDSTAEYYRSYIEHHIAPNIGKIKLEKLTTLDLQKFYNKTKKSGRVEKYEGMEDRSLSARTERGLHAMLRTALDQAVKERLIPYNPAIGCRLPPKEKKEMKILPAEQIGAYLSAAEEHGVLPMFYLELTTGLRRGELTALLWTDLDVKAKTLTVSKSAGRLKGEVRVTQPKTANSVRTICLPKETVDLLLQEHAKHPENPYMFPSPVTGRMYGPDCIGRLHKTLLKKAGITESLPFHGLRHTFATFAIQQGVDVKTVSNILGHYSAGFTLDTYAHVTGDMRREAADRMGGFIAQAI